ncbi:MAG: hydrogen gas-evolving membrane-bound hydrogenase subunit E [Clostridiaceae bacterium]|nr:hydrogen gas-evolving membrane-bound hydrogenase subunit E [Clostridiaceae bacterium]
MKININRLRSWIEGENTDREYSYIIPEQGIKAANTEVQDPKKYENAFEIRAFQKVYNVFSVIFCLTLILILLITISYLPRLGEADNPANNEVEQRYIEAGLEETGAVNIVAGMILDYRAFDTFGESCVLFTAVSCVFILLKKKPTDAERENDRIYEPKNDAILQSGATIVVPIGILFGVYVILNGHLSAGGGFSGGAVLGACLVLYLLAFGFERTERFFTERTFKFITVIPLTFYCLAKSYSFYTGANHLESYIPLGTPGAILSSGLILPLNICVGMVVTCTMYAFYCMFRKGSF